MEDQDDNKKSPNLPDGYEYLAGYTKKAQQDLRDIDAKIDNLPKDRIDTSAPKPFGTVKQSEAGKYNSERFRFEQQKVDVKAKLNEDISREIKNADPKDANAISNFSNHALKDGIYNAKGKNSEAFEKKQDSFAKLSEDAKANRSDNNFEKNAGLSRSNRVFLRSSYNVQSNQVNITQVNVSKDNISFSEMNARQPQQTSRVDQAISKSGFAEEQRSVDKQSGLKNVQQPQLETPSNKSVEGNSDKQVSRSERALNKSNFSKEQSGAANKTDFSDNKTDISSKAEPPGGGGAAPSKDEL